MRSLMRISPLAGEHEPQRLAWLLTNRIDARLGQLGSAGPARRPAR